MNDVIVGDDAVCDDYNVETMHKQLLAVDPRSHAWPARVNSYGRCRSLWCFQLLSFDGAAGRSQLIGPQSDSVLCDVGSHFRVQSLYLTGAILLAVRLAGLSPYVLQRQSPGASS